MNGDNSSEGKDAKLRVAEIHTLRVVFITAARLLSLGRIWWQKHCVGADSPLLGCFYTFFHVRLSGLTSWGNVACCICHLSRLRGLCSFFFLTCVLASSNL